LWSNGFTRGPNCKAHFRFWGLALGNHRDITTKMRDEVSWTDLRSCTQFQSNSFGCFGDKQTNNKANIPHYHREVITRSRLRHRPRRHRYVRKYCPDKMGLSHEHSLSTRTTPNFELDLHFGPNYTGDTCQVSCLHLQRLQRYHANEILLTQRNKQTYKHLPEYSQPFMLSSKRQDVTRTTFWYVDTYTHTLTHRHTENSTMLLLLAERPLVCFRYYYTYIRDSHSIS